MNQPPRITRSAMFMQIAEIVAQRATCPRASVGAVAVKDGRIVGTGYNGSPSGMPHCFDVGCQLDKIMQYATIEECEHFEDGYQYHCIRASHAEANLIAWCAREGISLHRAHLYTTHALCLNCAKLVINAGILAVYYRDLYAPEGIELIKDANILVFNASAP